MYTYKLAHAEDLKWKIFFPTEIRDCNDCSLKNASCIRKANKRIFTACVVLVVHRTASSELVFLSVPLYCALCFCKTANHLLGKFLRVERRVFRIIGSYTNSFPSLLDVDNNSCSKLLLAVEKFPSHLSPAVFAQEWKQNARHLHSQTSTRRQPLQNLLR